MLKKLLAIAASACALNAQAEPTFHQFSYTGFYHQESATFLPEMGIGGSFVGEDLDGNGVIERPELTSFMLSGDEYVGTCGEYTICGVFNFSYISGGKLYFESSWHMDWDGSIDVDGGFGSGRTTVGERTASWWSSSWSSGSATYLWTDQTRFAITPVPEPMTYAMLGVGLAVVGLSRRRRAHAQD